MDAAPAVVSFVYGVPAADLIDRAHRRGVHVIATATTVAEAAALDDAGVDAIVASGAEAAGHRVSFLRPADGRWSGCSRSCRRWSTPFGRR